MGPPVMTMLNSLVQALLQMSRQIPGVDQWSFSVLMPWPITFLPKHQTLSNICPSSMAPHDGVSGILSLWFKIHHKLFRYFSTFLVNIFRWIIPLWGISQFLSWFKDQCFPQCNIFSGRWTTETLASKFCWSDILPTVVNINPIPSSVDPFQNTRQNEFSLLCSLGSCN